MTFGFWLLGFSKKKYPNENQLYFHMKYNSFLQYGWFLQNFEKDFIQTDMLYVIAMIHLLITTNSQLYCKLNYYPMRNVKLHLVANGSKYCSAVYSQDRRLAKWSIGCY